MRGASLLVDTTVLVDLLRGREVALDFFRKNSARVEISAVSVAELYAGVRGDQENADLETFCSLFPVHAINVELARQAGLLRRQYLKSHGVGLGDALIAATALSEGLELATLNVRHFPMFPKLKPPY